jgi:hypothetical protein
MGVEIFTFYQGLAKDEKTGYFHFFFGASTSVLLPDITISPLAIQS